jgi:hypothetical protein
MQVPNRWNQIKKSTVVSSKHGTKTFKATLFVVVTYFATSSPVPQLSAIQLSHFFELTSHLPSLFSLSLLCGRYWKVLSFISQQGLVMEPLRRKQTKLGTLWPMGNLPIWPRPDTASCSLASVWPSPPYALLCVKMLVCRHHFSPVNTFMRKRKDLEPDPDLRLWLIDLDPGGLKTCGSGSLTVVGRFQEKPSGHVMLEGRKAAQAGWYGPQRPKALEVWHWWASCPT